MKSFLALFIAFMMLFQTTLPVSAAPNSVSEPQIRGEAAYLIDVQSGQTLYSKNGNERLAPASTTKIMTGLLAIEQGKLDELVTASPTMLDYEIVYGTRIYLEPGEQLTLEDMLYALLLNSANDAAVAIAEHIGGDLSRFVTMMNKRAESLGLKNTTFKNPSGLTEEGHLTTAHDLARIAQAAYANPTFREYIRTKSHVIPRSKENVPIEMFNENKLLWNDSSITGMKTGYTAVAQNTFVASASKNGRDLIGVILKSPGREIYTDMQELLNYGFEQFENTPYKAQGDSVQSFQVNDQEVNLLAQENIWLTRKIGGSLSEVSYKILPLPSKLNQVEAGQVITQLEVWEGNERIKSIPLTADRTVKAPSLAKKSLPWLPYLLMVLLAGMFLRTLRRRRRSRRYRYDRSQMRRREDL